MKWALSRLSSILVGVFATILAWVYKPVTWLLEMITDNVPAFDEQGFFYTLQTWMNYIQPWIDVKTILPLVELFLVFAVAMVGYRFIRSWMPF